MKMTTNQISGFERDSAEKKPPLSPPRRGVFVKTQIKKNPSLGRETQSVEFYPTTRN
jgi:hypothetical protein